LYQYFNAEKKKPLLQCAPFRKAPTTDTVSYYRRSNTSFETLLLGTTLPKYAVLEYQKEEIPDTGISFAGTCTPVVPGMPS
jgi:hypothetical protein